MQRKINAHYSQEEKKKQLKYPTIKGKLSKLSHIHYKAHYVGIFMLTMKYIAIFIQPTNSY